MRALILAALMGMACALSAQNTITGFEYWFDQDDANRTWVAATPPAATINTALAIDASALSLGYHRLRFRLRDANSAWSSVISRVFVVDPTGPNELQLLRYWSQQAEQDPADMVVVPFSDPAQFIDLINDLDFCTYTQTGATRAFFQLKDSRGQWSSVLARDINIDVVGQAPQQPDPISGPDAVEQGSTYTFTVPSVTGASAYGWVLDPGWSGSSNGPSIEVTINTPVSPPASIGAYAMNACGTSDTTWLLVLNVGIGEMQSGGSLHVLPNPTPGMAFLHLAQRPPARGLSVLDATGRTVLEQPIAPTSNLIALDLSGQGSGLYVVQVRFADGTRAVERIVKE